MATKKKLLQAAAGSAGGGAALNVEQLFSTYLYEGNGESQSIDNGINLGQSNDGGSAHFEPDDSNDTEEISLASANYITSGDFTVECFVWIEGLNSTNTNGYEVPTIFYFNSPRLSLTYDFVSPGGSADQAFNLFDTTYRFGSINQHPEGTYTNTWVHVAVVRNSGTIRCYVDGTEAFNFSNTTDYSGATLTIGNNSNGTPVQGHISNFRVVDGTAIYTSSFTPPTSELTAVSGTTLLTFTSENTLTDTSSNSHAFTITGNVSASTFGPFDAAEAGEGGLVWTKQRSGTEWHTLGDTERGATQYIFTNATNANTTKSDGITSFNSNGYSISSWVAHNESGEDYASWTFRKAPKFFDVVTYTGDGTTSQQIAHNLGVTPGLIIVKAASSVGSNPNWLVWHRSFPVSAGYLNDTIAFGGGEYGYSFNAPSDTYIDVRKNVLASGTNDSGITYVAYLFAHNDGDGEFGPDGDADIIKCGSYTGNGSSTGPEIDLGFEPQWVLVKCATAGGSSPAYEWYLMDTMRGMTGESDTWITVNSSTAESTATYSYVKPEPNGFKIQSGQSRVNASGETYIYMAIRRGPMAVPTDATEVFTVHDDVGEPSSSPLYLNNNHVIDAVLCNVRYISGSYGTFVEDRLRGGGNVLKTNATDAETSVTRIEFDHNTNNLIPAGGYGNNSGGTSENNVFWQWKRAPNYFDVVAYTGNGTAGRTVSHNLGVAPEMIWVKCRTNTYSWSVYHKGCNGGVNPEQYRLVLNDTNAESANSTRWNDTAPTDSVFTLGTASQGNGSGEDYIAYLFASLDGVSKVGSYTSDGTNGKVIDCGFTSGARFVLIKGASVATNWLLWDSERGIVAGNDPFLELNTTDAEDTGTDYIDPHSSGFIVNSGMNFGTNTFIFYAIA